MRAAPQQSQARCLAVKHVVKHSCRASQPSRAHTVHAIRAALKQTTTRRAPLPFLRAISAAVLPSQSAVSSAAAPPASTSERSRAGEPLRAAAHGGEEGRA